MLGRTNSILSLLLLSCFSVRSVHACSMCRSGDDRFFLNGAQRINGGGLIVMAEYFRTSKTSAVAHEEAHADIMLEAHDQQVLRMLFLYGLTERVTVLASVPYAVNKLAKGGVSEASGGFSDPEVTAIADLVETEEGDFELNASLGARVPVGNGDQADAEGNRLDQHLQAGTGAWSAMVGLQGANPLFAVPLFYSAGFQLNGSNSHDFSYGNVFRANVGTQIPVTNSIRLLAEGNMRYATRDEEGGQEDVNSGGTVVYFSPGLRISLPAGLAFRGQVQIPIVEELFGVQDEEVSVQVGLSIEP